MVEIIAVIRNKQFTQILRTIVIGMAYQTGFPAIAVFAERNGDIACTGLHINTAIGMLMVGRHGGWITNRTMVNPDVMRFRLATVNAIIIIILEADVAS